MPADRATLHTIARTARRFLEARWADDRRKEWGFPAATIPSTGSCSSTAMMMMKLLRELHHPLWEYHCGSYVKRAVGSLAKGHCWNANPTLGLILDLTADQFYDAAIVITDIGDTRYRSTTTATTVLPGYQSPYSAALEEYLKAHPWT